MIANYDLNAELNSLEIVLAKIERKVDNEKDG